MHDQIAPDGPQADRLFALVTEQAGYFTAAQAEDCGYSRSLLSHHVKGGRFTRVRHGLYRFTQYPPSLREEVLAAWMAAGSGAVVSHESALDLFGLSDAIPDTIHLTLPRSRRYMSAGPDVTVHVPRRSLREDEVIRREGLRVTTPERTIVDVAAAGLDPGQVELAVHQAVRRGLTTAEVLRAACAEGSNRVRRLIEQALSKAEVK